MKLLVAGTVAAVLASAQVAELPAARSDRSALERLAPELRTRVEAALDGGDLGTAGQALADELERKPDAQLYAFLGNTLFRAGQHLAAAVAFSRADKLAPLAAQDRFLLAMACVAAGRETDARRELMRLQAEHPRDAHYPYWIARLDYKQFRYKEALSGFRRTLELDPGNVRALDNIGLTQEMLGENDNAIASYRAAIASNQQRTPCLPYPAYNLGALERKLGHITEAEAALQESIRCNAEFAPALYQLALIRDGAGKTEEAAELLLKAVTVSPEYAEPRYVLGRVLRKLDRESEAAEHFRRYEELRAKQRPAQ